MIYYALVKTILNDSEFFKSFDIAVSFVTDDLDTLTLECLNYEHDVGPSYPYDFKHPGGTIAIDRAYGRFRTTYTVEQRECDEFMTEYAINKAAINTENERLSSIILNHHDDMKSSFITACRVIKHCWTNR